ncbi:DNA polymerase III subunit [Gemmata sp. JC673]|uniref:DNA polymerase III subunit n=1 Tax=Gemmata algarum TaxID=2975278 RepID=A0ABU5F8R2_9BACT|nr:DNA polymerase III subunit [Gemmata algarum]MDY3562783.1 DNA polymerase III subunit [Gemmata algarum]
MPWDRIRGQDAPRNTFAAALEAGRLAHSYLLVGPDGVGKRQFARELAKAFLCEHPPAKLTACDRCPACAQVNVGTHPDLLFLRTPEDKHELPVDEMRAFCAQIALKPTRGPRKIGIVEDADDFNASSANSFLKTLEEPPQGALLLLIGTSTDRQLSTILSRCQIVRFSPLSPADLKEVLAEQGIGDPTKLDRLAKLGAGSVTRALALDDDSIWQVRQKLLEGLMSPRPPFQQLAETWARFNEEAGKETAPQRLRTSLVLQFLIEAVQNALKLSLGTAVPELDAAEAPLLRAFADRIGAVGLMELLDALVEADFHVERRVQLMLIVEAVVTKFPRESSR